MRMKMKNEIKHLFGWPCLALLFGWLVAGMVGCNHPEPEPPVPPTPTPFPPDDEINIATINAIINVILGGHVDDDILRQLDFNQDGEISIADVNAVVKIILES